MNNKRGMALVVALLTSFILLALVASLFWVIASTSRQTEYAKNSAIALNLAEAGTADAIYRLNYCTGTDPTADAYPFLGTHIPFDLASSDTLVLPVPELPPEPAGVSYASYGIKRNLNDGYYVVGLLDDTLGSDTLVAVGIYKGIRRILTVPLRGKSVTPSTPRQVPTQGISEAFNKHVIYADTVTGSGTMVNGNIVYATGSTPTPAGGIWTKTYIDPEYFAPPTPSSPPAVIVDPGVSPPVSIYQFKDADGVAPYNCVPPYDDFIGLDIGTYANGGGVETYTITANIGAVEVLQFEASVASLDVNINSSIDDKVVVNNGRIIISNGTYTIGNASAGTPVLWASGDIIILISATPTINGDIYTSGSTLSVDSTSGQYNGYLESAGTISVGTGNTVGSSGIGNATGLIAAGAITLNGCIIYGTVSSGSGITLQNNSVTINATDAIGYDTAALLVLSSGAATVTVSVAPTITLGANQDAAIWASSTGGNVTVDVNAVLNPNYSSNASQSAIVAYTSGGVSVVNLAANTGATGECRPIYAYGPDSANTEIELTSASPTVYGSLITNGTILLNGGTLTYENTFFVTPATGNFSSDIFSGFSGGRRAYVPVWQGWRLR